MADPTRNADPEHAERQAPAVDHDTLTDVRDGLKAKVSTTLYVVELGKPWALDIAGVLMTTWGETLYSHVSSNAAHLRADLTERFGRATKLASRFGTYTVVYVGLDDEIPAEIAAHVRPAGEHAAGEDTTDE
jgi:hypothetical protein